MRTGDFWLWYIVCGYLFLFGSFILRYKLIKAANLLCRDYNEKAEKEYRELSKRR